MIGTLVGAGLGAVGSIFGGIAASKAMKRVKSNLENARKANEAWYERRYNEDATGRADAQRVLTQTQDAIRERNAAAAGAQAVMGGTAESVAAARAANAQAQAEAASRIAAEGAARKDRIENQYQQRDGQLVDQLNDMERGKAQAITSAIDGVAQAGAEFGSAWDDERARAKASSEM